MVNPTNKPTVATLKEVHLLRVFSDEEVAHLIQLGSPAAYEAHSNVVIEGELSWGIYVILDGIVGILKSNKMTGDVYDIGQLRAGSFFGEMSLIDDNPRSATIRALTDCHVFYISKDSFNQFLNKSADLKMRFFQSCIQDLVRRLRDLDDNYVVSQYQLWKSAVNKAG
jgi:CRP-like cAMP-binding protein